MWLQKDQRRSLRGEGPAPCLDCVRASIPALCGSAVWQDVALGEIGNGYTESLN